MTTTRILIVDDSLLFTDIFSEVLGTAPEVTVAGVAKNGEEAVRLTESLTPDLITMDLQMPVMDGLTAIEEIMSRRPTPILVLTGDPSGPEGNLNFEALKRGALELLPKPNLSDLEDPSVQHLLRRLTTLARIPVVYHPKSRLREQSGEIMSRAPAVKAKVVGVVASTGGPAALHTIFGRLPADFAAGVVVVQHLADGFVDNLASWLNEASELVVEVATDGARVRPGHIYMAPDQHHVRVDDIGYLQLDDDPPIGGHRPSGNRLLSSLAEAFPGQAVGVVLTGMGDDGAAGLLAMNQAGCPTVAQTPASAVVSSMPQAARKAADTVADLNRMPVVLSHLAGKSKRS